MRTVTILSVVSTASLLLLAGCEKAAPTGAEAGATTVKFGVLPAAAASSVAADYKILIDQLGATLGRPVELVVADSYDTLVRDLASGKLHLGQVSAYTYVRVKKAAGGSILVQQRREPSTEYRGVFVTAKSSKVKSLSDVKDKSVAYVDPSSSAGYFYPRIKLRSSGVDPDKDLRKTMFAGSHQKVLDMVKKGTADVGAVSEQTLAGGNGDLRVLDRTRVIPDDAIVATSTLPASDHDTVKTFFLNAHTNPKVQPFLKAHSIESYTTPNPDVYAVLEMEVTLTQGVGK